jgi:glycosyltransferase involved in cell wall biosynthesis
MKIAVCYNLPFGGAKRAMHELVKGMVQRHTVDFFSVNEEVVDGLEIGPFVRRTIVTLGPLPKSGLGMLRGLIGIRHTYRQIAKQVNEGDYDLAVISQCELTQSPYILKYLRIPSVYYCQESSNRFFEPHVVLRGRLAWLKRGVIWWRYRTVDRRNAQAATVICANSRYSVESIYRAYGVYPRYCPLGVDTDFFRSLNLPRQPEVLVVGSLSRSKAPEFVLESVATLACRPLVRFVYNFSSSVSPANLQKKAEELGVPIALTNLTSDNDLLEAYNRAAVVAVPSILEPMGFVSYEAMACETPVVGVAEAGIREAVQDGRTGLLTERDPVEFGRAIKMLLDDQALCSRMGAASREYVLRNRTWNQAHERLEQNLKRALVLGKMPTGCCRK